MNTTAPTGTSRGQLRWLVRREHLRPARLGETPLDGVAWAVRPTLGRGADRLIIGGPTHFTTRTEAFAYARRQARLTYYGTPRNRKDIPA